MLETEADAYHRMNAIDYIDFDAKVWRIVPCMREIQ